MQGRRVSATVQGGVCGVAGPRVSRDSAGGGGRSGGARDVRLCRGTGVRCKAGGCQRQCRGAGVRCEGGRRRGKNPGGEAQGREYRELQTAKQGGWYEMQSRGMHPSEQGVGVMCKAEGYRRHSKERIPTANRLHVHTSKERGGQVQVWAHAAGRLTAGGGGGSRGGGCKGSHCPRCHHRDNSCQPGVPTRDGDIGDTRVHKLFAQQLPQRAAYACP